MQEKPSRIEVLMVTVSINRPRLEWMEQEVKNQYDICHDSYGVVATFSDYVNVHRLIGYLDCYERLMTFVYKDLEIAQEADVKIKQEIYDLCKKQLIEEMDFILEVFGMGTWEHVEMKDAVLDVKKTLLELRETINACDQYPLV